AVGDDAGAGPERGVEAAVHRGERRTGGRGAPQEVLTEATTDVVAVDHAEPRVGAAGDQQHVTAGRLGATQGEADRGARLGLRAAGGGVRTATRGHVGLLCHDAVTAVAVRVGVVPEGVGGARVGAGGVVVAVRRRADAVAVVVDDDGDDHLVRVGDAVVVGHG